MLIHGLTFEQAQRAINNEIIFRLANMKKFLSATKRPTPGDLERAAKRRGVYGTLSLASLLGEHSLVVGEDGFLTAAPSAGPKGFDYRQRLRTPSGVPLKGEDEGAFCPEPRRV